MLARRLSFAALMAAAPLAVHAGQPAGKLPMPCLQVADAAAIAAALGSGYSLASAESREPGVSSCSWKDAENVLRLSVQFRDKRGFPAAAPTPAGAFDAAVARFEKTGMKAASMADLGQRASLVSFGPSYVVLVQRADGVVTLAAIDLPQDKTLAVARRVVAASPPSLGVHETVDNTPPPPAVLPTAPLTVDAEMRSWPCVRALTTPDVRAAGRREVLVEAVRPRPGHTGCVWRITTAQSEGLSIQIDTREEFASAGVTSAAGLYKLELEMAKVGRYEPLPGVGVEAVMMVEPQAAGAIVTRTANELVRVSCHDCSRDQIVALTRSALARLGAETKRP
jgi:hypothetical protein